MSSIITHRISAVPTDIVDVNTDFAVWRTDKTRYHAVNAKTKLTYQFDFLGKYSPGITNEVLLAIMLDRLQQFQLDEHACPENALVIEHLQHALAKLKERTIRLAYENEVNKVNTKSEPNVAVSAGRLRIGTDNFTAEELKKWGTWAMVAAAIKQLKEPLKAEELEMIRSVAYFSSSAAMNGFTELRQSLAQQDLI